MGMAEMSQGMPSRSRVALLFVLFFCICFGLGYPMLNRVDWRKAPGGLDDVLTYAALVTAPPVADARDHTQFRLLVPYLARPVYRVVQGRIGSWDPVMFALQVVDALFVSGTVTLLMLLVCDVGGYAVGLGSALLYLLNFAVPNLRLVGLVDAGEAFFLLAVIWCMMRERYWPLPVCAVLGGLTKESFALFLIVITLVWWLCSRRSMPKPRAAAAWIAGAWIAGAWIAAFAAMETVQWMVLGSYHSLMRFGMGLHQNSEYVRHFVDSLGDRNLWYVFFWLLPLSVPRMRRLPLAWRAATLAASGMAFVLDAYYGGQPGTIGRALFTVTGPLLTASTALLLFGDAGGKRVSDENVA